MAVSSEYRETSTHVYPMPLINVETERFYVKGLGGGVYLWKGEEHKLLLGLEYLPAHFRPNDSSSHAMKQLEKRYTSLLASAAWKYTGKEWGQIRLKVSADILGKNDGFLADVSYSYPLRLGDITLTPTVGLLWTSEDYNDYYYGISAGESSRSGLSSYEADEAFSPYASMRIDVDLDENWGLYAIASAMVLGDEIYDSPMVDERVKYGIGGGVRYTF